MLDHHYVRGMVKRRTRITLAMTVMIAIVHIRCEQIEQFRSLLKPLPVAHTG